MNRREFLLGMASIVGSAALTGCVPTASAAEGVGTQTSITGSADNPTELINSRAKVWTEANENCHEDMIAVHVEEANGESAEFCTETLPSLGSNRKSNAVVSTDTGTITLFDSGSQPYGSSNVVAIESTQ